MAEINTLTAILAKSVAYYRFTDNLNDSKNSYNLSGTVTYVTSAWGKCIKMTSGDVTVANNLGILVGAFTVAGWIQLPSEITSDVFPIFDLGNGTPPTIHINAQYEYNGGSKRLYINRSKPGVGNDVVTSSTVTLGTVWNHLGFTFDGSTLKIYLNGSEVGSGAASGVGTGGYGDSLILQKMVTNELKEDWAVFNSALSPAEMLEIATGTPLLVASSGNFGSFLINFM